MQKIATYCQIMQYVCLGVWFSMVYGHNWRIYKEQIGLITGAGWALIGATCGIIEKKHGWVLIIGYGHLIGIIRYK